ncbi:glycosyltransferase family 2 protein [Romeria aff. gracilis LEGE 07310]|uniref:Glycosyltransferase family 2 protein n=1 Tax=Vasconcelosia minhoensis LEGE 07310 TaxID=915328 RepID=A0A8J7A855_9CYAN|nr:glycosyltransferase family 2 protein [Romeria gracilis]MBE9078842.1 glycosyltransferase family 2 protein [Romeria aff. gracilis LEGE 07310]
MKLSVIVPVYNELHTLDSVLAEVARSLPQVAKEIIVVDDGSTDGTREWLAHTIQPATAEAELPSMALPSPPPAEFRPVVPTMPLSAGSSTVTEQRDRLPAPVIIRALFHPRNQGKGAALRTGFAAATGEVIVIQDADLEYTPQDWEPMWRLMAEGRADVVYGSRFYGNPHRVLYFHHFLGNKLITLLVNLLCNTMFTDIEVCYKMFRAEVLNGLALRCDGFGFEVEFTVKVSRSAHRWRLYESGVSYYGRTYDEGKKISWKDGFRALGYIIWFRLMG